MPEIAQIPNFMKIMDDLQVGNPVWLYGAAGTGKTTLGEKVAYAILERSEKEGKNPPYVTINCTQWTSPIELKGGQTIEGYKEGGLIEAWRDGKILILDELPKLDANTAGILNDALAKAAKKDAIIFNGLNHPIKKHSQFACIATGNTTGKATHAHYLGNNKQDASLLDRFSGSFYKIGFNRALEKMLVYPPLFHICDQIRSTIIKYEGKTAGDETEDLMTLRTMLNLQRSYELEMLRETGIKNAQGKVVSKVKQGKTLKDGLESYFSIMNREKAAHIQETVGIEGFYNSYRGRTSRDEFIKEYQRRAK